MVILLEKKFFFTYGAPSWEATVLLLEDIKRDVVLGSFWENQVGG
jgi:hypothetical protein